MFCSVDCFYRGALLFNFDGIPNVTLPDGAFQHWGYIREF